VPRRDDLHKILIIGSGPIVIGQACEFDYSGTQACKVLADEGYEVVLVNSNPATIMTDPDFAARTYIEPLDLATLTRIIEIERPDALLPTLGGQTALNLATELQESGLLDLWEVEMIGADAEAIRRAEDRHEFRTAMEEIGLRMPRSAIATSPSEVERAAGELGLPLVVRPAYTLGGSGGGIAHDRESLRHIADNGLRLSPIHQIMLEESVAGWHEFELEVMRDGADNVVVICSIENIDPMGVHTGDSVTVAPALTLTDGQYQELRDAAKAIIRKIGVDTGGSNVQFAVNPDTGDVVVIEMNPRVSRSSALASKATGFPIAKIATKLAIGYTLDEIPNDITRKTPASFEPALDYVVVKMPRWAFEKFPMADTELTTHMKSVGEAMAIGRTFKEAFLKALRSRELDTNPSLPAGRKALVRALAVPSCERYELIMHAYRQGLTLEEIHELTQVPSFFLAELRDIVGLEDEVRRSWSAPGADLLRRMKRYGFSDRRLGELAGIGEREVRSLRLEHGVVPVYKAVDTCAAEFEAETPYFYSTYEDENEAVPGERERIVILGSGPNRIGQGIEFDYCCVHAAMTVREHGYDAIMVNCNPETVSTDYDISSRLYFEPLTFEDVANICANEQAKGVVVQFGGQTPLKIAHALEDAGIPILGTPQDAIDLAEDRGRFGTLLDELDIRCPHYGVARSRDEALETGARIGYPCLVRPSYVLGGRAMQIVYSSDELARYIDTAVSASPAHPILIDKFLEDAIEVDVDALSDGDDVYIGGIMQHVEEAGVHSGDSSCVLPSISLGEGTLEQVRRQTKALARALGVKGLMNVQFAYQNYELYVLEVNPRASRTVPFVSKATGVQLAKLATRIILGATLAELDPPHRRVPRHVSVKEAVMPFNRFPGADYRLGPEMKATGEVMALADTFPQAFAKAQAAASAPLPTEGTIFLSVCDPDKSAATILGQRLHGLGFTILATRGTARALQSLGVPTIEVNKVTEGAPHIVDLIEEGRVAFVVNTPYGRGARSDGYEIRRAALERGIPCITTLAGASAAISAIEAARRPRVTVHCLQDLHRNGEE
jgi:carbamoyl-phosphate synthase large subunit